MKRLLLLIVSCPLLLLSCSAPDGGANRAERIRRALLSTDESGVLVAAHRGDWRGFPENSLPAIESAIEMGVDIVELDVQRTSDSVLILMHDSRLDRTTTGKGPVSEWTLDSIKTLRLRNGCAIKTKEVVPTLEEALLLAKGRVMINLDKADRYFDQVYALLEKTGTTQQIIMKGTKSPEKVAEQFGRYLKDVIYMPIVNLDKPDAERDVDVFVQNMRPAAFELLCADRSNPLPAAMPEKLRGKSLIWYNTLWDTLCAGYDDDAALKDRDAAYGFLIDTCGARIIQTDRPAYLIKYLKDRGLHD